MNSPKIISFDAEGTLVTTEFSDAVWHQAIPELYAKKNGLSPEQAKQYVRQEYDRLGDHRLEWYDISYWLRRWGLGDYQGLMQSYRDRIRYYSETKEILTRLNQRHTLIVTSSSAREFLNMLTEDVGSHFAAVFSSISDYGQVKTASFYRRVCQVMQVEPQEVVHVGDSWDFDFVAPSEIGIRAFYLDRRGTRQGPQVVTSLQEFLGRVIEVGTD